MDEAQLNALGYDIPNFRRALKSLEIVANKIEKIKQMDWEIFKYE
jgi:hypothetical protein